MRTDVDRHWAQIVQLRQELFAILHCCVVRFVISKPTIDWCVRSLGLREVDLNGDRIRIRHLCRRMHRGGTDQGSQKLAHHIGALWLEVVLQSKLDVARWNRSCGYSAAGRCIDGRTRSVEAGCIGQGEELRAERQYGLARQSEILEN